MTWDIRDNTDQPTAGFVATDASHDVIDEPMPVPAFIDGERGVFPVGTHRFDVGQPVSYADDSKPEIWKGGYEIIQLPALADHEPQYVIRNADEPYNLIVQQHELREDLGARLRGR
jgi:hypothetical protein